MRNSSPIPILFGMGRVGSGLKREKKKVGGEECLYQLRINH